MRIYEKAVKINFFAVFFLNLVGGIMSKMYLKYLEKKKDNNKYYLFKSGAFYIFLDEDAKNISKITTLCLTNLNKDVVKCGFPKNSLEKYLSIFDNLKLDIEIIEEPVNKIKKIDIDNVIEFLKEIKEYINE